MTPSGVDITTADRDPLDVLAEEFIARHRKGDAPSVSEYAAAHPHLADQIRQTFPAALMLERLKPSNTELASGISPQPGLNIERLGDYRIVREIGRGGMGVVYEAEQVSLARRVALKVLPHHPGMNPTLLHRFDLEARAAARLHHTNIVPVFGVGQENGVHYYAMQFIHGQALDAILEQLQREESPHSLPRLTAGPNEGYFQTAAWIAVQVADALQSAHDNGILHRDVKPSNLMLDAQGRVWVTDFGLAKLDDHPDVTRGTDVIGTLRYMAPERFAGACDAKSDVYSLGLVLYEMLSLRPAYQAASRHELIRQITSTAPKPPGQLDRRIPRDLETIVLKSIAPRSEDRYPSAAHLAEDLRRFLQDRPVLARRVGPVERARRWCRRNPVSAALVACVAALLVGLSVASLVVAGRFGKWAVKEAAARTEADDARKHAEATLAELYPSNALAAGRRGNAAEAALWFANAATLLPENSDASRANALRADLWSRSALTPVAAFSTPGQPVRSIEFDPSERRLLLRRDAEAPPQSWDIATQATVDTSAPAPTPEKDQPAVEMEGESLVWRNPATRQTTRTVPLGSRPSWKSADRARRRVAVAVAEQAKVFDTSTAAVIATFPIPRGANTSGFMSPDGMLLLVLAPGRSAELWSLATGGRAAPELDALASADLAAFSPSGRLLATHDPGGLVRVWSMPVGALPTTRIPAAAPYAVARFDLTGRLMMPAGLTTQGAALRSTQVFDVQTGAAIGPPIRPRGRIVAADFTPGAATVLLATAGESPERLLGFWNPSSGQSLGTGVSLPSDPVGVACDRACRRVAVRCLGGEVLVVDTHTRAATQTWRAPPLNAGSLWLVRDGGLRWSPDDQHLLTWGNAAVQVWDPATGQPRYANLKHNAACGDVQFSAKGDLIASAGWDGTVRVWDVATGRPVASPLVHDSPSCSVRFVDADARLLTQSTDGQVRIWDWRSNRLVQTLTHESYALRIGASSGGRLAVTAASGHSVAVWDLESRTPIGPALPASAQPVLIDLSPDGRFAAISGSPNGIDLLRLDGLDARTPSDHRRILAWTELTLGRKLERGNLVPLTSDQWLARWRDSGAPGRPDVSAATPWHRQQATVAREASDAAGELFHLRRLIDAKSADWAQHARAAHLHGSRREWSDAAGLLESALQMQDGDPRLGVDLGDVHLAAGNWEAAERAYSAVAQSNRAAWVRGNWWIAGPHPGGLSEVAPPERQVEVSRPISDTASWRLLREDDPTLEFHAYFNWAEHVNGYAQTFVYSLEERRVTLVLGSDDAMRLWLNGEKVFEHNGFLTVGEGRAEVTLRKGWNQVLAKVANDRRHHRVYLRIDSHDPPPRPLE